MGDTKLSGIVNASFRDEKCHEDPPVSAISASHNLPPSKQISDSLPNTKNIIKRFSVKKELIPLKIVLFCWYGAFSSLLPYMTIYLKQLGITAKETAFIYTFFPFAKLMGPAIGGLVADKIGRYKPVLYVALVFDVIFATGFLFIPPIPERTCTTHAQLSCLRGVSAEVTIKNCCDNNNICKTFSDVDSVTITGCEVMCEDFFINETKIRDLCLYSDAHHTCIQMNQTLNGLDIKYRSQELDSCIYTANSKNYSSESLCYAIHGNENCSARCNITLPHQEEIKCEAEWNDRFPTLAITFVIFIGFQIFVSICFALVEATALAMVKQHKDDYGRQRFWAVLSTAIFSPLTGFLVDLSSAKSGYNDYSPAFYLFDALIVSNIIMVYVLDLSVAPPAKKIIKNITQLIKMPEVIVFLIVVFFLGTFWGFLESFLFWHLLDLGSPKYLLGLTLTVGAIVGLPFLYTSDWFVVKFGRVNLLIVAFVFYCIRCVAYSYIYSPWWFVLLEAMEASTYHLMWVAAATYAASLAPKGLLATIQGCVAGLHYGMGRGSGSLIGGNLMSAIGNRAAFRSMGVAAGIIGVVYAFVYAVFLRRKNKRNDESKDTKLPDIEKKEEGALTTKDSPGITSYL